MKITLKNYAFSIHK